MTEAQGSLSELISLIAHPPEVLDSSNAQHRRILAAVRRHDEAGAAREMAEHLRGTEHILVGLLPKG
jgi:DNA-binding GntR family transcriptional regulator